MTADYKYRENPHKKVRAEQGPATRANRLAKADARSPIERFNQNLGLRITNAVGTMWAAYLFALLALVSLPAAIESKNALVMVSWIAQTFLQLVLLPIIMVGQNIQAKAADSRAIATFNDADAILHDAEEIQAHLDAQDKRISQLLAQTEKLEKQLIEGLKGKSK